MRTLFMFVCLSLLCLSCGEKERSNPLDPLNGDTHGSPSGFTAVALDRRVALRWEPLDLTGLLGLNLYRRELGSYALQLLAGSPFPAAAGAAVDSAVTNGVTYEYRLVPSIENHGEGIASPIRTATPGPDFAVVSDGCDGLITKLSADMRASVWTAGGFFYPLCVAGRGSRIWFVDPYTGVYCVTDEGVLIWKNPDFMLPVSLAVSDQGLCAVVDAGTAGVRLLSSEGASLLTISGGLQGPACVAFDAEGNLWVTDRAGGSVNKYSPDGVPLASFAGCREPRFLDIDFIDAACWVGDAATGELIKLNLMCSELLRLPFSKTMSAIETDREEGGCWVADAASDQLARVAQDGRILFRLGKLGGPVSVFASESGRTWVVGSTEPKITVVSGKGEFLSAVNFGQCPTSIIVLGN